jgi:hypothetical protein
LIDPNTGNEASFIPVVIAVVARMAGARKARYGIPPRAAVPCLSTSEPSPKPIAPR